MFSPLPVLRYAQMDFHDHRYRYIILFFMFSQASQDSFEFINEFLESSTTATHGTLNVSKKFILHSSECFAGLWRRIQKL